MKISCKIIALAVLFMLPCALQAKTEATCRYTYECIMSNPDTLDAVHSNYKGLKVVDKEYSQLKVRLAIEHAAEQSLVLAREFEHKEGLFPRSYNGKEYTTADYTWWCSGFLAGQLWLLYRNYPLMDGLYKYAELYTKRVEPARTITDQHDIGFILQCSWGQKYRITANDSCRAVLLDGARNLASRFVPVAGVTRSWDVKAWQTPVIIDNMMNLELLEKVGKREHINDLLYIAGSHAKTTMKNHFRPDYSSYHLVDYDSITGKVLKKQTVQGYSNSSAWARGQAWGLYGYTMMYRETGLRIYLEQARNIAKYLLGRSNWPDDHIPYWDFDDPAIPNTPRDVSAATVIASALLDLAVLDDNRTDAQRWLDWAVGMMKSLDTDTYTAKIGENGGFLLMHATGHKPAKSEVDQPLSYADYYYAEALDRLNRILSSKFVQSKK